MATTYGLASHVSSIHGKRIVVLKFSCLAARADAGEIGLAYYLLVTGLALEDWQSTKKVDRCCLNVDMFYWRYKKEGMYNVKRNI